MPLTAAPTQERVIKPFLLEKCPNVDTSMDEVDQWFQGKRMGFKQCGTSVLNQEI